MNKQTSNLTSAAPYKGTVPLFAGYGPNGLPDPELMEQMIAWGQEATLSDNTRRAYRTGWANWARWAEARGLSDFPAAPRDLQGWLVTLWKEGKKPSTLNVYLAAVADKHRGHPGDNPAEHPDVIRLMRGIRRQAVDDGYEPKQAKPLRQYDIELIAQHIARLLSQPGLPPQAIRRALVDLAMIAVSHDAALRSSELLALRWGDVSRSEDAETGRVLIRRSKTDQTGQGAVCAISADAIEALEAIRPPDAQAHHLIFPISANTLRRRFKAAAQRASIDPEGISGHSPRIGMAQDLAAAGTDIAAIMIAGRWKQHTTAVRYIRHLAADHTPVAQYLKTQTLMPDNPNTPKPLPLAGGGLPCLAQGLLEVGQ